jgi:predicted nuclease of predicted toxin-antitoxin system
MDEGLVGQPDGDVWQAANAEGQMPVTQDPDFSDIRQFQPGPLPDCSWFVCASREPMNF